MKRIIYLLFTTMAWMNVACSSDDKEINEPLPLIINEKNIQIEMSKSIPIASGNGDYTIEVATPEIIRVTYAGPDISTTNGYGSLHMLALKTGKTEVTVTDNISKASVELQVEVLELKSGVGGRIENSNHPLLSANKVVVFYAYDTRKVYAIGEIDKDGKMQTEHQGKYRLSLVDEEKAITLTYAHDDNQEISETYTLTESDEEAISTISIPMRWQWTAETKSQSLIPQPDIYLRLKGRDNDYKIGINISQVQ